MSASTREGAGSRYESLLSVENSVEARERYQKEAEFLAFYEHLGALGRNQEVAPNLVKGRTNISIPAFFALEGHGTNPVNRAALDLLPKYSYRSGYGDATETLVDDSGLRQAFALPESELQAARKGNAAQFIVANTLGLLDPVAEETFRGVSSLSRSSWREETRRLWEVRDFVRDIPRDFNEIVVGEVGDIASMAEQRGYTDFLDYLLDAKQVIAERVNLIFSHKAPSVSE